MQPADLATDFYSILGLYKQQFGATFSAFACDTAETKALAAQLMTEALRGDRKQVTDEELGIEAPADVET